MDKKATLITAGALLGLGAIYYFGIYLPSKDKNGAGTGGGSGSSGSGTSGKRGDNFPLKRGSRGDRVKALQLYLNHAGSYGLEVDGVFGRRTQAAVETELSASGGPVVKQVSKEYFDLFVLPYVTPLLASTNTAGYTYQWDIGHSNSFSNYVSNAILNN